MALLLVLGIAWLAAAGCQRRADRTAPREPTPEPAVAPADAKNVIVISIDSLRWDHLGCYGYGRPTSPTIDTFAAEGVLFKRAYATSPWTLPSHASLFTGLWADTHGVNTEKDQLAVTATTLAGRLRNSGYRTGAVVCAPLLSRHFRLDIGFDDYDTDLAALVPMKARRMKVAPDVTAKALAWLDKRDERPFFLFLHYWDVHHDYNPPRKYVEMFDPDYDGDERGLDITIRTDLRPGMNERDLKHIIARYDGEIRYTDDHLQPLLEGIAGRGLAENTMVWIVADHGEEFLDHGQMAHKKTCFEEVVRIPMLARIPWLKETARYVGDAVSLVDLFPTILSLLGVDYGDVPVQGADLTPTITGGARLDARILQVETAVGVLPRALKPVHWAALISPGKLKLHAWRARRDSEATPRVLLFDLGSDPREKHDLARRKKRARRRLMHELLTRKKAHDKIRKSLFSEETPQGTMKPELAETLRSLGYLE
ncbi:MAG: sulfatase [Candidatus Lernaella stagnicola]|nr:sulfatase [Candidatus Lernaella stagnicola]